ncbi:MAG: hypothetical protein H6622_01465 [Halobacteriovoraceae bacterium]|nr:hypothetical protein [Halobacteriovoraceae bacterium]
MKKYYKEFETEVLFQKLGQVWYAFTEIDNEIVYSGLPEGVDPLNTELELYSVIEEHLKKVAKIRKSPDALA